MDKKVIDFKSVSPKEKQAIWANNVLKKSMQPDLEKAKRLLEENGYIVIKK